MLGIKQTQLAFEGCPASGKTTSLQELRTNLFAKPVPENLDVLLPLVRQYHADASRYAFLLQLGALESCVASQHGGCAVTERSPMSSLIFALAMYNEKHMTTTEFELVAKYVALLGWMPKQVVFLQTDPATLHRRVAGRGRVEERRTQLRSVELLAAAHTTVLQLAGEKGVVVHSVDCAGSKDSVTATVSEILRRAGRL